MNHLYLKTRPSLEQKRNLKVLGFKWELHFNHSLIHGKAICQNVLIFAELKNRAEALSVQFLNGLSVILPEV